MRDSRAQVQETGLTAFSKLCGRTGLVANFLVDVGQGAGVVVLHVALLAIDGRDVLIDSVVAFHEFGHAEVLQLTIADLHHGGWCARENPPYFRVR